MSANSTHVVQQPIARYNLRSGSNINTDLTSNTSNINNANNTTKIENNTILSNQEQ